MVGLGAFRKGLGPVAKRIPTGVRMEFAPKTADYVLTVSHPALPNGHILAVDSTLTLDVATLGIDLSSANTWTVPQTITILNLTANAGQIVLDSDSLVTTTLQDSALTTSKIITFPNVTGTLAALNLAQTFSADQIFSEEVKGSKHSIVLSHLASVALGGNVRMLLRAGEVPMEI